MFTADQDASLTNLGQGAAVEKFDHELKRALSDLLDPNKESKKERKITLVVKLKPSDTQGVVNTTIECDATLAKRKSFSTNLLVGKGPGGVEAKELIQKQQKLEFGDRVVDIETKKS